MRERCQIAKADFAIAATESSTGFINSAPSSRVGPASQTYRAAPPAQRSRGLFCFGEPSGPFGISMSERSAPPQYVRSSSGPIASASNRERWAFASEKVGEMTDEPREPLSMHDFVVRRLMEETGITEQQARKLVADLGYQWSSLLREARLLAKKR